MMRILLPLSLLLLLARTCAFVLPTTPSRPISSRRWLMTTPPKEDVDAMKAEIAEMKAEALRRMNALKTELASQAANATVSTPPVPEATVVEPPEEESPPEASPATEEPATTVSKDEDTNEFEPRVAVSNEKRELKRALFESEAQVYQDSMNLLDGTRWKVMLNIGREPGTWMPKTWGASGERLLLNAEVEFTSEQLYEREEFLNGITNAKKMEVHSVDVGPTLTEDAHPIRIKDMGGWRVAPGEGPAGTDLLRFYVEIEEDVRHQGADVYAPKGRIYCTCGYFPIHRSSGLRDRLQEEQQRLSNRFEDLEMQMEMVSIWDKLKLGKELLDVRMELGKVAKQLEEVRIREPEKAVLRLSRKRDVGLTKEGGVCCKVVKGLAIEYHILGKFGLASIEKREEIEEADKLNP